MLVQELPVMGQSYLIYSCIRANRARYSSLQWRSFARANEAKIVRIRDAHCNNEELP